MPEKNRPFERVITAIDDGGAQSAVVALRDAYQLTHVTLHMAQTLSNDIHMPYVKTTYPSDWVSRYVLKGYANVDPVIAMGFNRQLPFDWREIEATLEAHNLMEDSLKFGLGESGYSIPVVDKSGRRSLVSVNSCLTGPEWDEQTKKNMEEWKELAFYLHREAIFDRYGQCDPAPRLGPRELECLKLIARGKDYKTIAILLGISAHTARDYLKSLRRKLDCAKLSQAVSKAHKLGIL